jgi:hypothetical protein
MSDEVVAQDETEEDDGLGTTTRSSREPTNVDEVRALGDDPYYAPQNPGDVGYEPKAIHPELDGEGGTKFVMGDEEFGSMAEALEAQAAAGEGTDLETSQDQPRLEAAEDDETTATTTDEP